MMQGVGDRPPRVGVPTRLCTRLLLLRLLRLLVLRLLRWWAGTLPSLRLLLLLTPLRLLLLPLLLLLHHFLYRLPVHLAHLPVVFGAEACAGADPRLEEVERALSLVLRHHVPRPLPTNKER